MNDWSTERGARVVRACGAPGRIFPKRGHGTLH